MDVCDILLGITLLLTGFLARISQTSKMYKKVLNFQNSADIFWGNAGPLAVDFNPALSNSNLNNVDLLLTDIQRGYMLGWKHSATINVSGAASIKRYCISSWIDDRTQAESLRAKTVSVGREQLENLADNEFYFEDLIGASVVDENGKIIGRVEDIEQYGAADVIVIRQDGKIYSLPFLDDIFTGFNAGEKKIFVNRENYNNMRVFD